METTDIPYADRVAVLLNYNRPIHQAGIAFAFDLDKKAIDIDMQNQ